MKLYVYDHCPFCIRARMPLGFKGIEAEVIYLPNDDEETPISMIGEKMLPILEHDGAYVGESLDIVKALDEMSGERMFDGTPDAALGDWISGALGPIYNLVIPRTPVESFPEFETASARSYFTEKKEAAFGAFDGLFAKTPALIAEVKAHLDTLVPLLPTARDIGIDDILLFPHLRGLEIVEGLRFPKEVEAYVARVSEASGVPRVTPQREVA